MFGKEITKTMLNLLYLLLLKRYINIFTSYQYYNLGLLPKTKTSFIYVKIMPSQAKACTLHSSLMDNFSSYSRFGQYFNTELLGSVKAELFMCRSPFRLLYKQHQSTVQRCTSTNRSRDSLVHCHCRQGNRNCIQPSTISTQSSPIKFPFRKIFSRASRLGQYLKVKLCEL